MSQSRMLCHNFEGMYVTFEVLCHIIPESYVTATFVCHNLLKSQKSYVMKLKGMLSFKYLNLLPFFIVFNKYYFCYYIFYIK